MENKINASKKYQHLMRERSLSTKCSCSECDSLLCFTKRRSPTTCTCSECKKSKNCPSNTHQNNVKRTCSHQINEIYLNTSKRAQTPRVDPTVLTSSGINFDLDRKRAIDANKPRPKSLNEYLSILVPETTSKVNHKIKPESLAQYIDIMTGNIPSKDKESSLDIYLKNFKEAKLEKPSQQASLHNKELPVKTKEENIVCKGTCKKCRQKKYTQVHSVMVPTPIININPRIAKLSSEIMDLSYKDSYSSVSAFSKISEQSRYDNHSTTNSLKYDFFNYDIFKRIKDVYKACSCKICECISTQIAKTDRCNCKPCECLDCTRYMSTLETKRKSKPLYHLRCSCSKYKTDSEKSFTNKSNHCSCKPCHCAQCQNNDFLKSCNCKPCQCIDYKKIVPQFQVFRGEVQHNSPCQCLPCKCAECLRGYRASSKDLVHEVSTTTSRQSQCQCDICPNDTCKDGLESCKCDNSNIFRKPVERVRHDYDIRTATIINDIYHHCDDVKEPGDQNAVAMLAVFPQKYQHSNSVKVCTCEECACINCDCQENAIDAIKSSRLFSCEHNLALKNESSNKNSNSKSCECYTHQKGKISLIKKYKLLRDSSSLLSKYHCNECDCIGDCTIVEGNFKYGHKTCLSKSNFSNVNSHINMLGSWPVKKGVVLTPAAHQSKIQNQIKVKDNFSTNLRCKTTSLHKIVCTDLSTLRKPQNNCNMSKDSYPKVIIPRSLVQLNEINNMEKYGIGKSERTRVIKYYKTNATLRCDTYMQSQSSNENISVSKYNLIKNRSGSNISELPSSEMTSKISFYKQDEVTPISEQKNKYCINYSHDLDHNHPSYIHFPRSTVETCLNDILKSDFDKEINLNAHNIMSKRKENQYFIPVSKNNRLKKSVSSIDIKESNNKNVNMMENKLTKLSYYEEHGPNYIKNYTFCNNTHFNNKLDKLNKSSSKKYKTELKPDGRSNGIQSLKTQLACHGCNCYNCYNLSNIKFNNCVKNDCSSTETIYTVCNYFDNIVKALNIKEDHERVNKTLKDAQQFHLHLINLLETYEKANQEFQSISDKLKISYINLIDEKNTNKNNNYDIKDVETDNIDSQSKEISTILPIILNVGQQPPNNKIFENMNDSTKSILQRQSLSNVTKTISNQGQTMLCHTESRRIKDKNVHQKIKDNNVNQNSQVIPKKGTVISEEIKVHKYIVNELNEKNSNESFYKKNLQETNSNNALNKICEPNIWNYDSNVKHILDIILKKIYLTQSEMNHSTTVKLVKNLLVPTEDISKPSFINKLGIENGNLLNEFKENTEDQKVKIQSVRKVSAHSVLVKWRPPLDLRNVRGYEMLVGGRAVQKLFSPRNCIAVVTCIPQSDKIEITIRTITYSDDDLSDTKDYATATIIYQPRYNKNHLYS